MAVKTDQLHSMEETIQICHEAGAKHVTRNSIIAAVYQGKRTLRRTKVGGRVYFRRSDIDKWLAGE